MGWGLAARLRMRSDGSVEGDVVGGGAALLHALQDGRRRRRVPGRRVHVHQRVQRHARPAAQHRRDNIRACPKPDPNPKSVKYAERRCGLERRRRKARTLRRRRCSGRPRAPRPIARRSAHTRRPRRAAAPAWGSPRSSGTAPHTCGCPALGGPARGAAPLAAGAGCRCCGGERHASSTPTSRAAHVGQHGEGAGRSMLCAPAGRTDPARSRLPRAAAEPGRVANDMCQRRQTGAGAPRAAPAAPPSRRRARARGCRSPRTASAARCTHCAQRAAPPGQQHHAYSCATQGSVKQ